MLNLKSVNRVFYFFLCFFPFAAAGLAAPRPLRVAPFYQMIGGAMFAAGAFAAWRLGAREVFFGTDEARRLALAGLLVVAPFLMVALLWVGLGTPWDASAPENVMRYLVLLSDAVCVTGAFVVLKESLNERGEKFFSNLGFAANLLAGAAYLIWMSFQTGAHVAKSRGGALSPAIASIADVFDVLLFAACALTYLTTAFFAAALGKTALLSRNASRAYVVISLVALAFLILRGLSFPDPTADTTPWFLRPGFIAGIPAIPWLMPFLLGVVLLRRAKPCNI